MCVYACIMLIIVTADTWTCISGHCWNQCLSSLLFSLQCVYVGKEQKQNQQVQGVLNSLFSIYLLAKQMKLLNPNDLKLCKSRKRDLKPGFSLIFFYANVTHFPTMRHCTFFIFRYKANVVHLPSLCRGRNKKKKSQSQHWISLNAALEKKSFIFAPISPSPVFPHPCFFYHL